MTEEFVNTKCEIFSLLSNHCHCQSCNGGPTRCAKTLLTYTVYRNVECSSWNVVGFLMLNLLPQLFFEGELKREPEAIFLKHKLQAGANLKTALLGSNLSA